MSLAFVLSLALSQAPAAEPTPAPEKPAEAVAAPAPAPAPTVTAKTETPWWQRVTLNGFARVGVFYTFPFRDEELVGSNGGFRMADFRLGADFHPIDHLSVYTSVEFAAPLVDAADPLSGRRIVDLRDAYVQYEFAPFIGVRVGQQRPGYYAEMLMSDGAVPFTTRSVLANGINPPDGYGPRNYLAPDRQLGLQLYSQRLGSELIGFKYAVGVFNGNGQNQLFNDNNSVEPMARVEIDVKQLVTLGLNGYYNQRTDGVRPNRLTANHLAYGADLSASVGGFTAMAAFLGKSITYSYPGLVPDASLGAMGQVRYLHEGTGLEGAVRAAWYEPSTAQTDDQVIEVTAMVAWRPFQLPFRVLLQYTHREEEKLASYANESVDLMLHARW
ncbi:MAG: hypothetical protein ACOZQL_33475 [Myxococcota bacterium]